MKVVIEAPWATECLFGELGTSVVTRVPRDASGVLEFVVPDGWEYGVVARNEPHSLMSLPVSTSMATGTVTLPLSPRQFKRVSVDAGRREVLLRGLSVFQASVSAGIRPIESKWAALPLSSALTDLLGLRPDKVGHHGLGIWARGVTVAVAEYPEGPLFLSVRAVPEGQTLGLKLPKVVAVRIRDENGGPQAGLRVQVIGGKARPFTVGTSMLPSRGYGISNEKGQVAVPEEDLVERTVGLNEPDVEIRSTERAKDGWDIVVSRPREVKASIDRAVAAGRPMYAAHSSGHPRAVNGDFVVRSGGTLDWANADGQWARLDIRAADVASAAREPEKWKVCVEPEDKQITVNCDFLPIDAMAATFQGRLPGEIGVPRTRYPYQVSADGPGYARIEASVSAVATKAGYLLAPLKGSPTVVKCTSEAGVPIAHVELVVLLTGSRAEEEISKAEGGRPHSPLECKATTDDKGNATIVLPSDARARVAAYRSGAGFGWGEVDAGKVCNVVLAPEAWIEIGSGDEPLMVRPIDERQWYARLALTSILSSWRQSGRVAWFERDRWSTKVYIGPLPASSLEVRVGEKSQEYKVTPGNTLEVGRK